MHRRIHRQTDRQYLAATSTVADPSSLLVSARVISYNTRQYNTVSRRRRRTITLITRAVQLSTRLHSGLSRIFKWRVRRQRAGDNRGLRADWGWARGDTRALCAPPGGYGDL